QHLGRDETLETEKAQYVLPDGSTLNIGPARFRAPELLFRPDLIGDESSGIHEVLAYAIQKSDMDLRRTLYSTIVLCGGIKGFGERLLTEVKKLAPKDVKIKVSPGSVIRCCSGSISVEMLSVSRYKENHCIIDLAETAQSPPRSKVNAFHLSPNWLN
uniref:Uncharacterized protein n=1 Tax=Dicentrarchus labrax TaxID=13489 RepID=A0A8C4F850_DICLA